MEASRSSSTSAASANDRPTPPLSVEAAVRRAREGDEREWRRMMQCSCRLKGRCILIDMHLGWQHGLPIEACDTCWAAGGPNTREGAQVRESIVGGTVQHFSQPAQAVRLGREVLVPLTIKHLAPEQVDTLNKRIDLHFSLNREGFWQAVKHTWRDAHDFIASLKSRGTDNRRASPRTLHQRQVSCFGRAGGGTVEGEPCASLVGSEKEGWWCGACGCGKSAMARLDDPEYSKLEYPVLMCPRRKRGFSNEET